MTKTCGRQRWQSWQTLLRIQNRFVIYTGAGISTSAQIPDYRSKQGVWTKLELGEETPKFDIEIASPTSAHKMVADLIHRGMCNLLVSTNIDGLHRKSGVPIDKIAELHGNAYREICEKCGIEYLRDYSTIRGGQSQDHLTGRECDCGGRLKDSIVNFGELLPERDLQLASKIALNTDVALVLGSSMRVSPACNLPLQAVTNKFGPRRGKLCVVNLQKTPFEDQIWLHIHAHIDDVMTELMHLCQSS